MHIKWAQTRAETRVFQQAFAQKLCVCFVCVCRLLISDLYCKQMKFQSSVRNSHDGSFRCHAMPIENYDIDAYSTMSATYRVKVSKNR